jgi:cholesterol oxidase
MLRSRSEALPLSAALGTRMSGNGDAIALSFDGDFRFGTATEDDAGPGPTITFTADIITPKGRSLIQDGVFPPRVLSQVGRTLALLQRRWRTAFRRDLVAAALDRSQVWLAMGTDCAAGRGELDRRGRLRIRWADANTSPAQRQREAWLVELARLQHADPVLVTDNLEGGASRAAITVHLGGGCPMADDISHGVVDAAGRVYDPRGGVHGGLFVLDGSTCPTSLGSNPSLGIAALTEHALAMAAEEGGK